VVVSVCSASLLGGFDPTAPHPWFSLRSNWFPLGHLLYFHRFTHGLGRELLRHATDLGSNAGMCLFDLGLDRLVEKDGNLLSGS
jgi:hypothetical protein